MPNFRVGIDIGGTFTDIVFLTDDGAMRTVKVPSTPDDYSRGIVEGIERTFATHGFDGTMVREIIHGATVATNAILERKGAKVGLITTEGFRDVLEIARLRMPRLYDLSSWDKPEPLVERHRRVEVRERVNHRGDVAQPLDERQATEVIEYLLGLGVEAIAVSLLNAYANGVHERRIGDLIRGRDSSMTVCLSSEVLPEIREYERTSTTVVNAYVAPVVKRYLHSLTAALQGLGIRAPLLVMQSTGGTMSAQAAAERPIHIIESGPAAGVVGAREIAGRLGFADVITFDMGGTTAKASVIDGGELRRVSGYDVGAGINIASRLLKGGGYHLRVPAIDLAEVGAGGGSLVTVDRAGSLKVGPESAGAAPGPVCYGQGGSVPTVTDANVVLGFINPEYLVGGALRLDAARAAAAIREQVAAPLGLKVEDAAQLIHLVANASMARAVRAVTTEQGRDPRQFVLMAFGGNGPVHAVTLAQSLGVPKVVIPPIPGLFSALGLLFPDIEHHYIRTYKRRLEALDVAELAGVVESLEEEGRTLLRSEGYEGTTVRLRRQVDMRYLGESSELRVEVAGAQFGPELIPLLRERFSEEHERTYGYRSDSEVIEVVNARVIAVGQTALARVPAKLSVTATAANSRPTSRRAYFGADHGWLETPVIARADVDHRGRDGPAIVEEYDTTILVPPGCTVSRDESENLIVVVGDSSPSTARKEKDAMASMKRGRDPLTIEVIKNALESIADDMAVTVARTARSFVVKEAMDFATALFNSRGEMIAQGTCLPLLVGSLPAALEAVLRTYGGTMVPGDVFALNDPYDGGSHLPDIVVIKPIFLGETLAGYAGTVAHHTDIGGRVAGGNACDSTEIYQEGLRIPPERLFAAGVANTTLLRILERNVRVPEQVIGDLHSEVAACKIGEREFLKLVGRYGLRELEAYCSDLLDYAEQYTRAEIADIPDGVYEYTDYLDDDGIDPDPIRIQVRITVEGNSMTVDFGGSAPQVKGGINAVLAYTRSAVSACVRSILDPRIPNNAGFSRPIRVVAPARSIVNCASPAPVAGRGLTAFRIADTVFGALAKLRPDKVPACGVSADFAISVGGYHPDGKPFVFLEFVLGSWGGGPHRDGMDALTPVIVNYSNVPAEFVEADVPVEVLCYELIPDSGGPGRFRGGLAMRRDYRFLADATLQVRSDRRKVLAYGLAGGQPGAPSRNILIGADGEPKEMPSKFLVQVKKGDILRGITAGAGGYGKPLERNPARVFADVREGKVTTAQAENCYGVVLRGTGAQLEIDVEATSARRKRFNLQDNV